MNNLNCICVETNTLLFVDKTIENYYNFPILIKILYYSLKIKLFFNRECNLCFRWKVDCLQIPCYPIIWIAVLCLSYLEKKIKRNLMLYVLYFISWYIYIPILIYVPIKYRSISLFFYFLSKSFGFHLLQMPKLI